ncbi:cytochrome P450 [Nocardia sp. NPDC051911]|uniref:cytochrome P450 n=1 Tax=Nocardia sp. NPDC051911 TaxID=3154648 RepID=UPI00343AA43C
MAGTDTTIHGIGSAVWLLASNPEAWAALRDGPGLARPAWEEALRLESPVSFFARGVTRDTEFGGVSLEKGDRVVMLFGSANRDESHYPRADRFEIDRAPTDHVAFGYGVHGCAGQGLARIEGVAILTTLARRVERIEIAGPPTRHLNNTVYGLESLPVRLHPAGS